MWDGKGYFLLTENIVKHHSLILQPDVSIPDEKGISTRNDFDHPNIFSVKQYFYWLSELSSRALPTHGKLEPTPALGSPLFALIGVPFYIIADSLHYSTVKFTSIFVNSLIISLTATVVFAFASEFYRSKKIGIVLSIVVGVGSFIWPYVSSYLEQPLAALIMISCLYFLYIASRNTGTFATSTSSDDKREGRTVRQNSKLGMFSPILAGLFLGLQSFAQPGSIMIVPGIAIIAIYIFRKDKAKLFQFLAGLFFFLGFQAYINLDLHGSITNFGYGIAQGRAHTDTEGLYGLFISPGGGLLTYFPLIVLLPPGIYYLWRQNKVFCIAFLYVFLSIWIFYGTLHYGLVWNGSVWGPRYLIPTIPALALMIGSVLSAFSSKSNYNYTSRTNNKRAVIGSRHSLLSHVIRPHYFKSILKILFFFLILSGFLTNLLGVLVWYQVGYVYAYTFHIDVYNDINDYQYIFWYPRFSPVLLHWEVLTTGWWKDLHDIYPIYNGWKTCIPDNFLYCNFGTLPIIALLLGTASVGLVLTSIIFDKKFKIYSRHRTKFDI